MSKLRGILKFSQRDYRFYALTQDGRKFFCNDYENSIVTKNELLAEILFHVNENDESCEIEVIN